MKEMKLLLVIALFGVMVSCAGGQKKSENQQQETEAQALDAQASESVISYYGVYEGTLPCADCEGIKTVLTLNEDTTYDLKSEYLGKEGGIFEESGVYNLIGEDLIELVTPSSGDKTYYKVLEEAVALSDPSGTVNEGELAEFYILKKK